MPATPDDLFARLDALGVAYTLYPHPAVHTVAESSAVTAHIPGLHCRNLSCATKGARSSSSPWATPRAWT